MSFRTAENSTQSVHFRPDIKTWAAVSVGAALLVTADILSRVYQSMMKMLFDLGGGQTSAISMLLASLTVLPVALYVYTKWALKADGGRKPNQRSLILGAFLCGVLIFVLFLTFIYFSGAEHRDDYFRRLASFAEFLKNGNTYELFAFYFVIHMLRPIFEETIFRGLVFQALADRYGFLLGALISAAGFMAIHIGMSVPLVLIFLFGLVSSTLVHISRNLYPSYVMHVTYNILITVFAMVYDM